MAGGIAISSPILMVAWRLMTSGERGFKVATFCNNNTRSSTHGRHRVRVRVRVGPRPTR